MFLWVSVVVSADGKHYAVSVSSVPKECKQAWFSNEAGVIYPAKALGCE